MSNHVIKLYRPRESGLEYERDLQGHSNTIGDLQFALPDAPHALHSCAADGTVLGWDTRVGKQVRRPASLLSPSSKWGPPQSSGRWVARRSPATPSRALARPLTRVLPGGGEHRVWGGLGVGGAPAMCLRPPTHMSTSCRPP